MSRASELLREAARGLVAERGPDAGLRVVRVTRTAAAGAQSLLEAALAGQPEGSGAPITGPDGALYLMYGASGWGADGYGD